MPRSSQSATPSIQMSERSDESRPEETSTSGAAHRHGMRTFLFSLYCNRTETFQTHKQRFKLCFPIVSNYLADAFVTADSFRDGNLPLTLNPDLLYASPLSNLLHHSATKAFQTPVLIQIVLCDRVKLLGRCFCHYQQFPTDDIVYGQLESLRNKYVVISKFFVTKTVGTYSTRNCCSESN